MTSPKGPSSDQIPSSSPFRRNKRNPSHEEALHHNEHQPATGDRRRITSERACNNNHYDYTTMRLSLATFIVALATVSAFTSPFGRAPFSSSLKMSTKVEHDVPIVITGTNIDLTPALEDYVKKKLERPLSKISGIKESECEVFLNVNKNPKVSRSHRDVLGSNALSFIITSCMQANSLNSPFHHHHLCRSRMPTASKSPRTSRESPFAPPRRLPTCMLPLMLLPIVWYVKILFSVCGCVVVVLFSIIHIMYYVILLH